jgi:hypothetical protein
VIKHLADACGGVHLGAPKATKRSCVSSTACSLRWVWNRSVHPPGRSAGSPG